MKVAVQRSEKESDWPELAEASIRVCYPFAIDLKAGSS
jgi:hypothetical protein